MAKYQRRKIGSIVKGKDGKPDYIKITDNVELTSGSFLNLESKIMQLESLQNAFDAGKLPEDVFEKVKEGLDKIPDFVRFEIIKVTKE